MAQPKLQLQFARSAVLRYGLAVASFALALGLALLAQRYGFRNVEVPLFLFAVALTAWYAGPRPAALAVVLSIAFFDYFFTEPRYSFYVTSSDIPYLIVFISFALLVAWFSAVRRRVEEDLRQARDHLQIEVVERTQQASLLNLTHDAIFVRDMDFTITYWNIGAQELYGWAVEDAIGKHSHQLLQTVFPAPLEDIHAELLRTGRWEGELKRTTAQGLQVVVAGRWALHLPPQAGGSPTNTACQQSEICEFGVFEGDCPRRRTRVEIDTRLVAGGWQANADLGPDRYQSTRGH